MKCWSQLPAANQKKPTHPAEQSRLTILRRWWVTFLWVELIYEWYQSADYSSTQGGRNSSQMPRIEVLKSVVVQRWSFSWPPFKQLTTTPANWTVHCLPRGAFSLVERNCFDCCTAVTTEMAKFILEGGNHSISLGISICTGPQCNLFSAPKGGLNLALYWSVLSSRL